MAADELPHKTWHVAVWAPQGTPGADPEYRLSREEIGALTPQLLGVPVTYDHTGIHDAIDTLEDVGFGVSKVSVAKAMLMASKDRPEQRPLGIVTDAWVSGNGDGMCAFYTVGKAPRSLIDAGSLASVSLTHIAEQMQPLELSLCNVPARPGSRVVLSASRDVDVAAYKARSLQQPKPIANMADAQMTDAASVGAPAADASSTKRLTFDEALATVPEEVRAVLATGLEKMKSDLVVASKELEEQKKKAEAAKTRADIQNTDAVILEDQLKRMLAAMPEQYQDMYMKTVPSLLKGFSSGNPQHAMDAAVRTVMCASRAIQLRDFSDDGFGSKRQRTVAGSVATETAAAAAAETPVVAAAAPAAPVVAAVEAVTVAAATAAATPKTAESPAKAAPLTATERLNMALGRVFD